MSKIYLIRHGEKESSKGDPKLSAIGIIQVDKTAKYLSRFDVDEVFASPSVRTRETAEVIGKELRLQVTVSDLLKERANWGNETECSFDDFLQIWDKASEERSWDPPIGESSLKTGKRLEKFIRQQYNSKDKDIVIVTHGGIISDYLRNIASEDELGRINPLFLEKKDRLIKECSITTLEISLGGKYPKILSIADTTHLFV